MDVELAHQVRAVVVDRLGADPELCRILVVWLPGHELKWTSRSRSVRKSGERLVSGFETTDRRIAAMEVAQ